MLCVCQVLNQSKGGRPRTVDTEKSARTRVLRKDPPGYAVKIATLFTTIIEEVNAAHNLELYPLTLSDVLPHLEEGCALLKAVDVSHETRVLAQSAINMVDEAGRACKAGVLGVLATPNDQGSIPHRRVVELSGMSSTHVRDARKNVMAGNLGTFGNQTKVQGVSRTGTPAAEKEATRQWMSNENPARSGDQQEICWMVKDKEDFYFEDYRSLPGQLAIYELALDLDHSLHSIKIPANSWERNIKTYNGIFIIYIYIYNIYIYFFFICDFVSSCCSETHTTCFRRKAQWRPRKAYRPPTSSAATHVCFSGKGIGRKCIGGGSRRHDFAGRSASRHFGSDWR
jgi:hypothetical protein